MSTNSTLRLSRPLAAPRRGLLDRDWNKALIVLLTVLASAAVLWVVWHIVSPILRTVVLLGGLFAVPLAGVLWVLLGAAYRSVVVEPCPRRQLFPVPRFRCAPPRSAADQ